MAQLVTYTPTNVKFAVFNSQNLQVATASYTDPLYNSTSLIDIVEPVTFAHGLISVTTSTTSVTGVDTEFLTDFIAGQFLYYYNMTGDPVLIGQIATISSDTTITLTENYLGVTQTNVNCGKTDKVFGANEQYLVRIPVQYNNVNNGIPTQIIIPNWSIYKSTNGQLNNSTNMNLERFSNVNTPQIAATPPLQNVPFRLNVLSKNSWEETTGNFFPTFDVTALPLYSFAIINVNPGASPPLLSTNTLYKFFINDAALNNGVLVTSAGITSAQLTQFGY
jgi:hypothetical protein